MYEPATHFEESATWGPPSYPSRLPVTVPLLLCRPGSSLPRRNPGEIGRSFRYTGLKLISPGLSSYPAVWTPSGQKGSGEVF